MASRKLWDAVGRDQEGRDGSHRGVLQEVLEQGLKMLGSPPPGEAGGVPGRGTSSPFDWLLVSVVSPIAQRGLKPPGPELLRPHKGEPGSSVSWHSQALWGVKLSMEAKWK